MSQTELAEHLNVTFATVNRWENGRAIPNKLAQTRLYEICKEGSVPVYDLTLSKIKKTAENISLPAGRVLLYHGSKSGVEGKIEPKSRPHCDFGKGFYMGTEANQAITLICDYDKCELLGDSISEHPEPGENAGVAVGPCHLYCCQMATQLP